jgi:hypothetical protein
MFERPSEGHAWMTVSFSKSGPCRGDLRCRGQPRAVSEIATSCQGWMVIISSSWSTLDWQNLLAE